MKHLKRAIKSLAFIFVAIFFFPPILVVLMVLSIHQTSLTQKTPSTGTRYPMVKPAMD